MEINKIVKVSYPDSWFGNYYNQTPGNTGVWGNYKFEINNDIKECDYWIICEYSSNKETILCPPENIIFIPGEAGSQRMYSLDCIAQFGTVITSRDDIQHHKIIKSHYLSPWHVLKTYDELKAAKLVEKKSDLCIISSDSTLLDGHKKRFAFVNKMIGHFKNKLAVYGKGINFIADKYDGLKDYKYSIAIENSVFKGYFSEKIVDCYLAQTIPIYFGCPNITDYFPENSMILIDIDNYKGAIQKIEQAIDNKYYEKNIEAVLHSKQLILDKYQFIPTVVESIEKNKDHFSNNKKWVTIKPESHFTKNDIYMRVVNKIKREIKNIISKD